MFSRLILLTYLQKERVGAHVCEQGEGRGRGNVKQTPHRVESNVGLAPRILTL